MFLFLLILALRTDSLQLSCALFLQGHLHLAQVGSNATVHLLKSRRSYTWWPSTTDLAGRLWVVIKVTEQCVINATQFLWSPNHAHYAVLHFWFLFFFTSILYSKMYFSFFFPGWDGVSHAQILPPQDDRHVWQEVLLRPRHYRSVHHHLTLFFKHTVIILCF